MTGFITGLQISAGGVPKLPIDRGMVMAQGMAGDKQKDRRHHGGPDRALCLYSQELIDQLVLEGHPIFPGAVGENVTIAGVDWRAMQPGVRVELGKVVAVVTSFAVPCKTIRDAFHDGRSVRISEKMFPGWSRVYVSIERPGVLAVGDPVEILTVPR